MFGKVELERMPVRKVWDHEINLREEFKASKAKVYLLMGVIKVSSIFRVCPFIRNKGDRCKSELCSLQDGSQLCTNK